MEFQSFSRDENQSEWNVAKVNWALIERLGKLWHKKASVKKDELDYSVEGLRPDFPVHLVPFNDHPRFLEAPEDLKRRVLSWGWIAYNERTITAEEKVANPAFQLILNNEIPGVDQADIKKAVAQSMVDEQYHTLMHLNANALTKKVRNLENTRLPKSVTYKSYLKCISEVHSEWERNVVTLLFATVSEISINALLSLLSSDQEIQPLHRLITFHHDRDEVMHMLLLEEIAKNIFINMTNSERNVFLRWLPEALRSFVATDYSAWRQILEITGFEDAEEIIEDTSKISSRNNLVRDYQGLERLVNDLGIASAIEFDFGAARGGRTSAAIPEQIKVGE